MNEYLVDTIVFSKVGFNLSSFETTDAEWTDDYGLIVLLHEKRKFKIVIKSFLIPSIQLNFPIVRRREKDQIVKSRMIAL